VKVEPARAGVVDMNNIQALILPSIGKEELIAGAFTNREYCLSSPTVLCRKTKNLKAFWLFSNDFGPTVRVRETIGP
jgi:hypothetical protein